MKWGRITAAAAVLALVAACGGGGGGSSGSDVTIVVTSPDQFAAEVYEGELIPSLVIDWRFDGSPESLAGETIHVVAELPDTFLFSETPHVGFYSDHSGGILQLIGANAPQTVSTYSGTVRLHVCLDAQCREMLDVENNDVPYTVRVKQGLKLSASAAPLSTTFGTAPTPVIVGLTLPEDVVSWTVKPAFGGENFGVIRADKASEGHAIVVSASELVLPDTRYTEIVRVEAQTSSGQTLVRTFDASLSTGSSNVPYAFQRAEAVYEVEYGYPNMSESLGVGLLLPAGDSEGVTYLGATFVAWPPEAATNDYRNGWLYATGMLPIGRQYLVDARVQGCYDGNCLPPGRYSAVLHYRYTPAAGTPVDLDFPVHMDILQP